MRYQLMTCLLFLTACPCEGLDQFCLPPLTSGGDPNTDLELCTSISEASEDAKEMVCEEHPWTRKEVCDPNHTLPSCQDILSILADCPDLTFCDYIPCADALAKADCGERPAVCDPLSECFEKHS